MNSWVIIKTKRYGNMFVAIGYRLKRSRLFKGNADFRYCASKDGHFMATMGIYWSIVAMCLLILVLQAKKLIKDKGYISS